MNLFSTWYNPVAKVFENILFADKRGAYSTQRRPRIHRRQRDRRHNEAFRRRYHQQEEATRQEGKEGQCNVVNSISKE